MEGISNHQIIALLDVGLKLYGAAPPGANEYYLERHYPTPFFTERDAREDGAEEYGCKPEECKVAIAKLVDARDVFDDGDVQWLVEHVCNRFGLDGEGIQILDPEAALRELRDLVARHLDIWGHGHRAWVWEWKEQ